MGGLPPDSSTTPRAPTTHPDARFLPRAVTYPSMAQPSSLAAGARTQLRRFCSPKSPPEGLGKINAIGLTPRDCSSRAFGTRFASHRVIRGKKCPSCVEPPRGFEPRTYALRDNFPSPRPRGKFGDSNMFRLIQTRADPLRPMELGLTMGPGIGLSELVASVGTSHHRCVDAGGVAQGQDDAPWRRMGIRMLLRGPDFTGLLSARGWPRRRPQEGSRRGEPRSSRRAGCPNSIHWSGPG